MESHAEDLRAEIRDDALADAVKRDWRTANLPSQDAALCAYALKLTLSPGAIGPDDVRALRDAGLDDRGICDAVQVIGFFNYFNRVADGLGIDPEPGAAD